MTARHRIFIALPIGREIQEQFQEWKQKFLSLPVRWVSAKNLHITLIPPWEQDDVEKVKQSLLSFSGGGALFSVEFTRVMYGHSRGEFRLIWAEGRAPDEILALITRLEQTLFLPRNSRQYALHLTLARFRAETFSTFPVKKLDERVSWKQECSSFVLLESHLLPTGAEYETLLTIPL